MGLEKKLTYEWSDFDGDYEKTIQDIELHNGGQINECWPNAGAFICMSLPVPPIPYKDVKRVRKSPSAYGRVKRSERVAKNSPLWNDGSNIPPGVREEDL